MAVLEIKFPSERGGGYYPITPTPRPLLDTRSYKIENSRINTEKMVFDKKIKSLDKNFKNSCLEIRISCLGSHNDISMVILIFVLYKIHLDRQNFVL